MMMFDFILYVVFFKTLSGQEPVRLWLKNQSQENKKILGEAIKLVQLRWPLGLPLIRKLEVDLWEVRVNLQDKQTALILFTVHKNTMVLLHSFIKKTQKTPKQDLDLARSRKNSFKESGL